MKTLAPKGVPRSPRLKEEHLEVLRIRFRFGRDSGNSGLRPNPMGFWAVSEWKSLIDILCGSGKMLFVDRIRRNSRLNDVLWKILWWLFTLKWVSGKFGLTNHSRGTQSRFLLKSVSIAINSQYVDKNTSWMILKRFGVGRICQLVCDAFDTILSRQTH